jgi:hypothetical protein
MGYEPSEEKKQIKLQEYIKKKEEWVVGKL